MVGHIRIVGANAAGFAEGAEIFAGIEAEAGGRAESSGIFALEGGTVGLGGVLDQDQIMPLANIGNFIHVAGMAIEMNRQHGRGFRRNGGFQLAGVYAVGVRVDIDERRRGADVGDRPNGGDKGVGHGDDFVAGFDSGGNQG